MNRYQVLSAQQVADMTKRAARAQALRDQVDAAAARAVAVIVGESTATTVDLAMGAFQAVVALEQAIGLPVPAYLAPVKRWAGGSPDLNAWYWDYSAY